MLFVAFYFKALYIITYFQCIKCPKELEILKNKKQNFRHKIRKKMNYVGLTKAYHEIQFSSVYREVLTNT